MLLLGESMRQLHALNSNQHYRARSTKYSDNKKYRGTRGKKPTLREKCNIFVNIVHISSILKYKYSCFVIALDEDHHFYDHFISFHIITQSKKVKSGPIAPLLG